MLYETTVTVDSNVSLIQHEPHSLIVAWCTSLSKAGKMRIQCGEWRDEGVFKSSFVHDQLIRTILRKARRILGRLENWKDLLIIHWRGNVCLIIGLGNAKLT